MDVEPEQAERCTMLNPERLKELNCSFCGKRRSEVAHLFAAQDALAAICEACVRSCWEILEGVEAPA